MNNKEYAGNIGLPTMAGTVVNSTFVHLINFSACGQVSASKPPLRQAKNVVCYGKKTPKLKVTRQKRVNLHLLQNISNITL